MDSMLAMVGLSEAESEAYRLLVVAESATADEISRDSDLDHSTAQLLLLALEAKGLASGTGEAPGRFTVVPPQLTLVPQLQRHADALDEARSAVFDLVETYRRRARGRSAGDAVEIISGAASLRQSLRQLQGGAREEMQWFCRAGYVAMSPESNQEEYDALARGVRYRALYEQQYFETPGAVDNVSGGVRAGESARAVPRLPVRMAIADRSAALMPLSSDGVPAGLTAALVRESSLLDALIDLFEKYWEVGAPLRVTEEGQIAGTGATDQAGPVAEDRHLLSLMVAGMTDVAIAGQLRVSKRTIQRRVQALMTLAGVTTRMQLGWQAARRNWI